MKNIFTKMREWLGGRKKDTPTPVPNKPTPKRTLYGTEPIKCLQVPKRNVDRNYPNYKKKWKPRNNLVTLSPGAVINLNSIKGALPDERNRILAKGFDGFKIGGRR